LKRKFNEILVLDTNIILNDSDNLFQLSENGNNLIVLPETVLDELDNKKSGFDEINFQAREFGRLFETAEIIEVKRESKKVTTSTHLKKGDVNVYIDVVSKTKYSSDNDTTIPSGIRNDRKIIEIARDLSIDNKNKVFFLSLDTMCRHRALSLDIKVRTLNLNDDKDIYLYAELNVEEHSDMYDSFQIESMDIQKSVQHIQITDNNGKPQYYYRTGGIFRQIDEKELNRQEVNPQNMGQKALSSMMLDEYYNVIVSDSPAGSGKTLLALSAALKLFDKSKGKYDKIVYIRKTVISDNEELGYLPGSLDEKMAGYLAPLYSNLEYIISKKYNNRKDKLTKEELDSKMEDFMTKYNIQFMYEGHLRGGNIRNALVILDEFQNNSISSAKTILTRISENCKVFVLGSTKQIDSKFLNKYNNALTYLLSRIGEENMNVNVTGCNLNKTVRSAIAEWADEF